MPIVTGLVHEAGSSTVPPVSSDFSGNDFASYAAMSGSVGDIARDTRTGRLYKLVQVGSDEWFLPFEFVPLDTYDYVKDGSNNEARIVYEEALPVYMTANSASKSANANLVINNGAGTNYVVLPLPSPGSTKRLLVVFPATLPATTQFTAYISGTNDSFPRLLVQQTSAKLSVITTPIANGINTPSTTEPIFMYSDTRVSDANTIIFTPSTPIGQEAVAPRWQLESYMTHYFGVTNFDSASSIAIRHIFCVEL